MFNPDTAPVSVYMPTFETAARSLKVVPIIAPRDGGLLRGRGKADFARKPRIAVGHADGATLMMRVNTFEPVLFAQFHNYVLIGIAHDRKNVIDALSRNRRRNRFQYLHGDLPD
jgi:hypothetical protein